MQAELTYYDVLEVAHNASPEVIQAAYRRLCQKYHPDLNRHDPDAHYKMVRFNAAYAVLSDPDQRRAYDALLAAARRTESGMGATQSDREASKGWGHLVKEAVKVVAGGVVSLVQLVLGFVVWLFIIGFVIGVVREVKNGDSAKPQAGPVAAEAKTAPHAKPDGPKSSSASTHRDEQDNHTVAFLQRIADDLNKRAPYVVGEGLYIRRAEVSGKKLILTGVLSKYRKEELNVARFEAGTRKGLAIDLCADHDLRQYLNQGATLVYAYFGNDDQLIAEIPIRHADCDMERKADGGV